MNNKLFVLALSLFTLAACDSGDEPDPSVVTKNHLVVSPERLNFDDNGDTKVLNITATENWTISLNNLEWLNVNPSNGVGSQNVEVTASKNNGAERIGTITVTSGSVRKMVTVVQQAAAYTPPSVPGSDDNVPPSMQ